jgi:hypothetical protein
MQANQAVSAEVSTYKMEMVYRNLYQLIQAYHRGETWDPVDDLASNAK